MCVMVCVLGLTTLAPNVGLPLTCEPFVYTKSLEFYFLLWGLVCSIVVALCECIGKGHFDHTALVRDSAKKSLLNRSSQY